MTSSRTAGALLLRLVVALTTLFVAVGCANEPKVVDHAFTFNVGWDSPDVDLLDYRYGTSLLPGVQNSEHLRAEGRAPLNANVNGPMRQGDSLYVKWRVKSTGQIYEDTVDLRRRLPRDITKHRIYFLIKGPQLYVYLIPPKSRKRPAGAPVNGPPGYQDLDVKTIYPD
jgi:hypothetical protein